MMIEIADFLGHLHFGIRTYVGATSLLDHYPRGHCPDSTTRVDMIPQGFILRIRHHRLDEGIGLALKLRQPHLKLLIAPDELDGFQCDIEQPLGVVGVVRNVLMVMVKLMMQMVWPWRGKY